MFVNTRHHLTLDACFTTRVFRNPVVNGFGNGYEICKASEKLQKYLSRAARVLTGASYDIRTADVFETLAWETLEIRRDYLKSMFTYKILNNLAAPNLNNLFLKISNCPISYNFSVTIVHMNNAEQYC